MKRRPREVRIQRAGYFCDGQIAIVTERYWSRKLKTRMAAIVAYDKKARRVVEVAVPAEWCVPVEAKRP